MEENSRQISIEDALALLRPLIDEVNRMLEKIGEAATLQEFARHSELVKTSQYAYNLVFQYVRDISSLLPKQLAGFQDLALRISTDIQLFFVPPEQWRSGYFDFGENVPQAYVSYLLKRSNPFSAFLSDLRLIEIGKVCSAEIERRSLEYPEPTKMVSYKWATPEREALKYLRERTLSERAQLAKKYGLNALSELEKTIQRALNKQTKLYEKEYGIEISTAAYSKMSYYVDSNFPTFEKEIWAELIEKVLIPTGVDKYIEIQSQVLVGSVAIDYFGLSIKGGYSPQEYEASQAVSEMCEILKIKGIAFNYKDSLLGVGFSYDDKQQEAEMTAQEGLLKGMNIWAGKDLHEIIEAGLTGHLRRSLNKAIVNKILDEIDKIKKVEVEIGDKLGDKERVKVQQVIPESGLVGKKTDKDTGESLLELIASRQGLVETPFPDEVDNRQRLNSILQEARLTDRQRMVFDLTRDGRSDTEIVLALEKAFGKRVTEGNVRKLKHEAIRKLKLYAQQE